MKGYLAFREMELHPGLRFAHGGIEFGAYFLFDGADYRYVDEGRECDVLLPGVALHRDDWYRLVDEDSHLATMLEEEADKHVRSFRGQDELKVSIAAAYAHGLERAARLIRDRNT